ncbi:thiamin pyrophosphokinase 1 [Calliphora vicina]|uniref:thiamin pyrophosphokinase 1 n=1 Tax=Calliphora vicina TaxID=7373 RepID=UPI00325A831D
MRTKTILFWLNNKKYYCNYKKFIMSNDSGTKRNGGLTKTYQWQPADIITQPHKVGNGHVCLVLNREIRIPQHVVTELWQNASVRCCIDGGGNRWRQFLKLHKNIECKLKPPDMITGDFDSITEETKQYFNSKDTQYIHTPDQNATDFSKAIMAVRPILVEKHIQDIIVYHDTSGRFDQIMANINTIFKYEQDFFNIYLLSGNSLTWLLRPGKHSITIPSELVQDKRWCALIPVGQEATNVTTKGLKWNLTNHCLKFGGMVSTSNTYALCEVEVETNTPLIWSMGIFNFSDD